MNIREQIIYALFGMVMVSILFLAVFGNNGYLDLKNLRAKHDGLIAENQKALHENRLLLEEIERLKTDLDYVESIARQELGMVSEKELILKPHVLIEP